MKNFDVLASSGAFIGRKNGRNHKVFLSIYDELSCDGVEFMVYNGWYDRIDEIIADFKEKGVKVKTLHADKMIGEEFGQGNVNNALHLFEKNCKIANSLGAKTAVLHLWNGPSSDDNIEINLSAIPQLYDIADKYSVTLAIENVVCRNCDPYDHLAEIYKRYPYARFTFDVKMAQFHGTLGKIYTDYKFLWDRIVHLHINDYSGGVKDWERLKTLHIDEGDIDFKTFFNFVKNIGYKGTLTLECTSMGEEGEPYPEKMNESIEKVREYLV